MISDASILKITEGLRTKKFSCVELVEETYQTIENHGKEINALITVIDKDEVLTQAKTCDQNMSPLQSPLYGLPFVLKDVYVTKGIRTTAASYVLKDYIPQYNATVYQRILDAGGILIGKTNMDAWGHGGSSENTDFGPVHNPWDITRVAGGSSGGSAAAVASRMCVYSIGEDTGGSIRNPSAWSNISGLKVTYGRVSRYGAIAYASSFDTIGPMAKSVEDIAVILELIAGKDECDATSSPRAVPRYAKDLQKDIRGLKVGLPKEFFGEGLDGEIKEKIYEASKELNKLGATIVDLSMPLFDYGLAVYYLIGPSETSSNLGRYDGVRYGNTRDHFTEESMRRIMIGTYALSAGYYDAYYKQAQKVRTLFKEEYTKALTKCDVLLMPVNPTPPPKIGELLSDPLQNLLADIYTVSQNPVGVPSLALPCGFTKSGLPIGMQIVGNMFTEEILLRIGYQYQQVTDFHTKSPPLFS